MTLSSMEELNEPLQWPEPGVTRIPYRVYSDPVIYALEQQRIFRGPVWNFLCLEIDIPNSGDYKTSTVGEIPIIVTRDDDGEIHAMVNRCPHKGALVCLKERGNAKMLTCIYHSWSFDMAGKLKGIAFRNGLGGKGGLPKEFDPEKHGLELLRIEVFCGLVFGTFSEATPSVESYLGQPMSKFIRRNLGRPLKPLGMHSQIIHNNWKLYAENVRDSYHATLLHTFYTTFKINRLDMDGGIVLAKDKWHHISYAKRETFEEAEEYQRDKIHAAQYDSHLEGPHLLNAWNEFDDGITHSIQAIFPNLAIQFTLNSLAVRFFVPRGVDKTELFWFYVGYEDDTEEKTAMRVMQGNLTGAAGLVSLEDGCINEFVQRGTHGSEGSMGLAEMGGGSVESSDSSRATEAAIRGFWTGYRRIMEFD
ncbi:MAG: Rieske 2Fe-2S domain-containing protein [Alphaproteobacteria bacterium]|nr:Rieske 2Fe-2S domain-containing protein [Alphaproteobacteria bacterium]